MNTCIETCILQCNVILALILVLQCNVILALILVYYNAILIIRYSDTLHGREIG